MSDAINDPHPKTTVCLTSCLSGTRVTVPSKRKRVSRKMATHKWYEWTGWVERHTSKVMKAFIKAPRRPETALRRMLYHYPQIVLPYRRYLLFSGVTGCIYAIAEYILG